MNTEICSPWDQLNYEEKNRVLYERQKAMLEQFRDRHAISQQQYEKSLHDLMEKMGMKEDTSHEYLDIVNEDGQPTGAIISRDEAHRDGILHRTAHVWVVRPKDTGYDILLQKRSDEKESFSGMYDTSSAGHIPAGVEPLPSAIRELSEELGITAAPTDLSYAGIFRIQYEKDFHGSPTDMTGRSNREIRTYAFLDSLGVEFDSTDHSDQPATTMEACAELLFHW